MEEQGQEEMEKRAKRAKISKNIIQPILYMLPAILIFGIFIVYPICYNIYLSFYDWNMVADKEFVGGKNYASYLTSTEFLQALLNTVGYIVILLIFCFALPYGIAYILGHVVEKGSRFYRAILFFPSLLSLAVAAIVFMWLLNSVNGPVALMLGKVGLTSPNWFQTPKYVIIAIGIMVAWRSFGYNLILYLGAIVDVPGELIEAARLENTSNWKIFTRIIIPLTSPTALFVFILTVSYSLQYVVTPILGAHAAADTCGAKRPAERARAIREYESRRSGAGFRRGVRYIPVGVRPVRKIRGETLRMSSAQRHDRRPREAG